MNDFDQQVGRQCGMHAIRNLLKDFDITEQDMNNAASWCVEESKDAPENHASDAGDWSMDTLKKILHDRGYQVERAVKKTTENIRWAVPTMEECMSNESIVGFIVQSNNHYTSIRKDNTFWEFCDSMREGPRHVSARSICREALYERCNLFMVRRI